MAYKNAIFRVMIFLKSQIHSEGVWVLWVLTLMGGYGKHAEGHIGAYILHGELLLSQCVHEKIAIYSCEKQR